MSGTQLIHQECFMLRVALKVIDIIGEKKRGAYVAHTLRRISKGGGWSIKKYGMST